MKFKFILGVQIGRLWMHENRCVFGDRLINDEDKVR